MSHFIFAALAAGLTLSTLPSCAHALTIQDATKMIRNGKHGSAPEGFQLFVDPKINRTRYVLPEMPATAEIWVLNMDARPDRWDCAQKQLAGSPYPVRRYSGVTLDEVDTLCPHLVESKGFYQPAPARALMCSNYLLWEQMSNTSTADFLIVYEDDIVIQGAPNGKAHWVVTEDLLNGPCQGWDHVMVDVWTTRKHAWSGFQNDQTSSGMCSDASPGIPLSPPAQASGRPKGGSHMQVIRRTSIPKLLEILRKAPIAPGGSKTWRAYKDAHGRPPHAGMDKMPWHEFPNVVARTFQPAIVTQGELAQEAMKAICDPAAIASDDHDK